MIIQGSTTAFAQALLSGQVNFYHTGPAHRYKIALYNANANLNPSTTIYTPNNEVVGTGYTAGGKDLVVSTEPTTNNQYNTAYVSFANVIWSPASFTARGALVYDTDTLLACFVLNFGSDKICNSSFTVQFPAATYSSAILTISSYTAANVISSGD